MYFCSLGSYFRLQSHVYDNSQGINIKRPPIPCEHFLLYVRKGTCYKVFVNFTYDFMKLLTIYR